MTPDRRSFAGVPARELAGLAGILALAAILRFVALPTRGRWDADQGHDMLTLLELTQRGIVPLLGPPTSIGDFHHGVLYYYFLAPAAWLSGSDPVAVTGMIALAGIAAVAVTWWLARSIGGPAAAFIAGLLMATSAAAVDESTFIWNPNLIALSSSIALAAAWRGWSAPQARRARSRGSWRSPARSRRCTATSSGACSRPRSWSRGSSTSDGRDRAGRRRLLIAGGIGLLLLVLSYVPLLVHELQTNFSEVQAALAFLSGGGEPSSMSLPVRFLVVGLRVLAWPLVGLITEAPVAAILAASGVIAAVVWRSIAGDDAGERRAARWFGLTLLWTTAALTVAASGLSTVVPRLPNDHYHAFADPIVFVTVGLGLAALARLPRDARARAAAGRPLPRLGAIAAGAIVVAIVGFNLVRQPPAVSPDGGWPGGDAAAQRVLDALGEEATSEDLVLHSLPDFKSGDALRFPLVHRGASVPELDDLTAYDRLPNIVICDDLFKEAIGAPCGGPAEDARVAPYGQRLVDRFEAAPDRWISVYVPG